MTREQLLEQWEQNYKKGLLSFWMLLAMVDDPQYAYGMKAKIEALSLGSMSADENSIYRALRRFSKEGLIKSEMHPSDQGPDRRYFQLTLKGRELLGDFIERNILIFNDKNLQQRFQELRNSK